MMLLIGNLPKPIIFRISRFWTTLGAGDYFKRSGHGFTDGGAFSLEAYLPVQFWRLFNAL
jgi:hypothetical protein